MEALDKINHSIP